jgi:energy-coupling factor transport system substrate-specific component
MKEVFTMWRHTQLVVLTALSAAIYAAVLIPFKGFPIVPGFIELRPANVFPVVFGLLFGPAGAWGAAIGNLIGDFFGTLSIASAAGFVGNFFLAYLPYKMWGAYFREGENMEQNVNSGKKLALYIAVAFLASTVCALIIGWFIALLGLVPFVAGLTLIVSNNAIMALVLGPVLLLALYPRVKRWGLLWTEIMEPEEVSASRLRVVGNVLVWVGGLGGAATGLILSFTGASPMGAGVGLALVPFLIAILVGAFMLGGREQVEAAHEMIEGEGAESER